MSVAGKCYLGSRDSYFTYKMVCLSVVAGQCQMSIEFGLLLKASGLLFSFLFCFVFEERMGAEDLN